jgi:hypothetical protein
MAYDAGRGESVLFGGYGASTLGDTWTLAGTTWTAQTPTTSPPPRFTMAMAYDGARHDVVMFGGWDFTTIFGDTWTWDGTDWTQRI